MKKAVNQSKDQIYIRSIGKWVTVSEEIFKEYYAGASAYRREERCHGRCVCPRYKWWFCDMNCATCEYSRAGNQLSLDAEMIIDGHTTTLAEIIVDKAADTEKTVMQADLLAALYREFKKLDPEKRKMCRLYMEGKSAREAAKIMNMPHTTYDRRLGKLLAGLYGKLKKYR